MFNTPSIRPVPNAPRDPDAFLRWGTTREGRYELVGGRVFEMMVNVSRGHARVTGFATALLIQLLDRREHQVSSADFGVRTPKGIRYPDVLVDPVSPDRRELASANPILIVEVLSPSSLEVDFVQKRAEYTAIPSLQTYLILAQDEPRAWTWTRGPDGWPEEAEMVEGDEAQVTVPALGVTLPLAFMYLDGDAE